MTNFANYNFFFGDLEKKFLHRGRVKTRFLTAFERMTWKTTLECFFRRFLKIWIPYKIWLKSLFGTHDQLSVKLSALVKKYVCLCRWIYVMRSFLMLFLFCDFGVWGEGKVLDGLGCCVSVGRFHSGFF